MATNEAPQWGDGPDPSEAAVNETLVRSFQSQDGIRGAHFFDGEHCEFVTWDLVVQFCSKMKNDNNPSHVEFEEKLLHTIANTDPTTEYVLVRQVGESVSIECYRQLGI